MRSDDLMMLLRGIDYTKLKRRKRFSLAGRASSDERWVNARHSKSVLPERFDDPRSSKRSFFHKIRKMSEPFEGLAR